jgi:hypothetical protein
MRVGAAADDHDGDERERHAAQGHRTDAFAGEEADAHGQRRGYERRHGREHAHRTDGQGPVQQGERRRRRNAGRGAPRDGAGVEARPDRGPQQQLDDEAGRRGDHDDAQHMSPTGGHAAEEVGGAVRERAGHGEQQGGGHWNDRRVQCDDRHE